MKTKTTKKKTDLVQPYILDKVDFTYASYAQVGATDRDIRIAFADIVWVTYPTQHGMRPSVGIVMPIKTARELIAVLAARLEQTEIQLAERAKEKV